MGFAEANSDDEFSPSTVTNCNMTTQVIALVDPRCVVVACAVVVARFLCLCLL